MWSDLLQLIPQNLKQNALDTLVDVVSEQAKKYAGDALSAKVKKLRSDAAFHDAFEAGLSRAMQRFIEEYQVKDEDLVLAISREQDFFLNKEIQTSLIAILKQPGTYLDEEREAILQTFATVLPGRINRERVDRAVSYLLKCLAQELWHLPELMPIYSLQFQRIAAESAREQVNLQKAQLQALTSLNVGVREALLQLTDALVEQKLLSAGEESNLASQPKVYHNLPQPDFEKFIGRESEIADIDRILQPYPQSQIHLVTIDGIGGIGKSALALEIAFRYLQTYSQLAENNRFDAIIWASAKLTILTGEGIQKRPQSLRTLDDIYRAIAVTLDREDIIRSRPEEQPEIVRQVLRRQRTLLIIDNLETVDDRAVNTFLRELPAPTKAIVTTRHRIDVAYPVRLTGMAWHHAKTLIEQECKKKTVLLKTGEARRIFDRTGGVPLAIVWSIAQMGFGYSIESIMSRLGTPNSDIVQFCFDGAIEPLRGKPSHKLLMSLSLVAVDASREALGYIANLSELDRDDGFVDLEKLSLVNKNANRFSLLPLTKIFAIDEAEKHPEFKNVAKKRWFDYLKELCQEPIGEYYWRYRSHAFYEEGDNLLDAVEWAYNEGSSTDVFVLARAAYDYLEVVGDWNRILSLGGKALELAISNRSAIDIARFGNVLGWIHYQQGDYEEALENYHLALNEYRRINNRGGESITLQHESSVARKRKDFTKAKDLNDKAWQIANELNDGDLKALIETNYGKLARDWGKWEEAWQYFANVRDYFEKRVAESPRDEPLARSTWGHLAIVAIHLGRPEEAKEYCLRSIEYFEERGTKGFLATLKYRLARAEIALGEFDEALKHLEEAIEWFDRLGMKPDHDEAKITLEQHLK